MAGPHLPRTRPADRADSTTDSADLADLADLALRAARSGAALAATERGRAGARLGADTKSSTTDLVTRADRETELHIRRVVLAERPGDVVTGEEFGNGSPDPGGRDSPPAVRWIVDPIDGTTNYVYGYPGWCVSIAAEVAGRIAAAAVVSDTGDEFVAAAGRGATHNGSPCRVPDPAPDLPHALVATGFGYSRERRLVQGRILADLIGEIRDIRRGGSAALDLCAVACGRVDAYFELGPQEWDLAAGGLIAAEAGASVTIRPLVDDPGYWVLAAPPVLAEALSAHLDGEGSPSGVADGRQ